MRHIVVSKFGNAPNLFSNDLRHGMIGEWETTKLLKILSDDKDNFVTYYGKAIWDTEKAHKYFVNNNVQYIESSIDDDVNAVSKIAKIDEFHIILGPHTYYNGGRHIPAWESIKESLVTQRLLERVAPQIKLINASPKAQLFFYLSDRRFLLQAADLTHRPLRIYAQSLSKRSYASTFLALDDITSVFSADTFVKPFRFETLLLYGDDIDAAKSRVYDGNKDIYLIVPANQVTSDKEIEVSRLDKIIEYTKDISNYTICGKWTSQKALNAFKASTMKHFTEGLDLPDYNKLLRHSQYALVLFNTDDGPSIFDNNWLTVKYWECICNGCLTFVENNNISKLPFIPEELQVGSGDELRDKLNKCNNDSTYKNTLIDLQNSLIKPEYFNGAYFNNWLAMERAQ